jgi:general stress protein 26
MATNQNSQQLQFLKEKIQEIGSAIFFNLSDSVLKLPTSIVSTLQVDDYGYVWFFVQKPKQTLKEFEMEFPVRLDFFKKGTSYFLQVMGKGWVVTDPEELNAYVTLPEDMKSIANGQMLLVKVKIMKAEYYETGVRKAKPSWWQSTVNVFSNMLGLNQYRPGNTYFPAS